MTWTIALAVMTVAACQTDPDDSLKIPPKKVASTAVPSNNTGLSQSEVQGSAPNNHRHTAQAELARLDPRLPVPLRPAMAWEQKQKMMMFLQAIERVTDKLATEDWEALAEAAAPLGTTPKKRRQCQHRKAPAEVIAAMALDFRCRADAIAEAARAHNTAAVLRATSDTLKACNRCHAAVRQDVVDAATWPAHAPALHEH